MTNAVDERGAEASRKFRFCRRRCSSRPQHVRFEHRGGLAGFENLKGKHHDEFERR